jgi:acyl-CoA thioester hydrolase
MHFFELDPAASRTRTQMRVRFCDTDLMGIVHHANYFAYFEAGRVEWLRRRGVAYTEWARRGMHMPVVDAQIKYRMPARFDDLIDVETTLGELRFASARFDYAITREGALLAEGSTRLACVNDAHQVQRFSDEMIEILRAPEKPV